MAAIMPYLGQKRDPESELFLKVIANILTELIRKEESKRGNNVNITVTKFHGLRAPSIPLPDYLQRIAQFSGCSDEAFVLMLIYLDRLVTKRDIELDSLNVHRLVITGTLLAAKFFDDHYLDNSHYSAVGGLSRNEINDLELEMLFLLGFNLYVSTENYNTYHQTLTNMAQNLTVQQQQQQQQSIPAVLPGMQVQQQHQQQMQHQQQQQQQQQHHHQQQRQQQMQQQQQQQQQQLSTNNACSPAFGRRGLAAAPALFDPCSSAGAGRPALAPPAVSAGRPGPFTGGLGATLASLGPASGTPTAQPYPSPLLSRPVSAQPSLPVSMLVQHLRQASAAAAASAPVVVSPHGPNGSSSSLAAPPLAPSTPDLQAYQRLAVPCAGGEAASLPSCSNSRHSSSEDLLSVGSKRARNVFEGPSSPSCLTALAAKHQFLEPARHAFADEGYRPGQQHQHQQGASSTAAAAAAPHMVLAAQAAFAPLAPSAPKTPRKSAITSKYRGVSWHKRDCRWFARLWVDNKIKYLGSFQSEERAALAVDDQEIAHKGSLARRLNFPDAAERQRLKDSFRQEDEARQARSKEAERLAIAEKAARAKFRAAEPFLGGVLRDISPTSAAARSPKEEADDERAKAEPKADD